MSAVGGRARAVAAAVLLAPFLAAAAPDALDLHGAFATRSPWRFVVERHGDELDPIMQSDRVPRPIGLCLSRDDGRTCAPVIDTLLLRPTVPDEYSTPRYLEAARMVRVEGRPLLLLRAASLHGVNGDQRVGTIVFGYDRARDRFVPVYAKQVGRNNDQEVRYVAAGPLRGAMIAAEPTQDAPFAFWVTVDRLRGGTYAPVLRYRSATRYADGNPLAVIDSELPSIERRLGLWHSGLPLPAPAGCHAPRLIRGALWCDKPPPAVAP